jgi:hypothetical protein
MEPARWAAFCDSKSVVSGPQVRRLVCLGIACGIGLYAAFAGAQSQITVVPADSVWREDISSAPLHPDSATVISRLEGVGGWVSGTMRIDFSIEVLHADGSTPFLDFTPTGDFFDPDCDHLPVPMPAGGAQSGDDLESGWGHGA